MDSRSFIARIKKSVRDGAAQAVIDLLSDPPGRRPPPDLLKQAAWYASLSDADKRMLADIVMRAVDAGLFHFLCVLDGVGFIEDGPDQGDFVLSYVKNGSTRLNSPEDEMLHDLFKDPAVY